MAHAGKDEDKIANTVKEIASECSQISNPDRCEFSFKLMECVHAAAEKRGLDTKKLI